MHEESTVTLLAQVASYLFIYFLESQFSNKLSLAAFFKISSGWRYLHIFF